MRTRPSNSRPAASLNRKGLAEWQVPFAKHEPWALGESPFWHPTEQRLVWVDIVGQKVLRGDPVTGQVEVWPMPAQPGCVAPVRWVGDRNLGSSGSGAPAGVAAPAAGGWVVALRTGVFLATQWGGELKLLAAAPYDTATTRFNDGKASPEGLLCVGTYFEPRNAPNAELWCLDLRHPPRAGEPPTLQRLLADSMVANGLAWSPNGDTLYWADTGRHRVGVWAWPLRCGAVRLPDSAADQAAAPGPEHRTWAQFDPKPEGWIFELGAAASLYGGRPDGAAVDVLGNYWVALYEGGQIAQLSPTGAVLRTIATPVQRPTMPCWGGPTLGTLFLTTARHGRSATEAAEQPLAGQVFSLETAAQGVPVDWMEIHVCYK